MSTSRRFTDYLQGDSQITAKASPALPPGLTMIELGDMENAMNAINVSRTEISKLWKRLKPDHYFDAGEISILRTYFGLKLRSKDPPLSSLYEEVSEDDVEIDDDGEQFLPGSVRLRDVGNSADIDDIDCAVARICLTEIQDRLPQWASFRDNRVHFGRDPFERPEREVTPLNPQRLMCINWADSAPGYSWPEDYYVTLLPGFNRYVVTVSVDSTDMYGVTDFAIGWFSAREGIAVGSRRLLLRWWNCCRDRCQEAWESLFDEGLIDEAEAYQMRHAVWPNDAESEL